MKKKIRCPLCQGRLFDADSAMELTLRPIGREAEVQNAFYVKCPKCGNICAVTPHGKNPTKNDASPADPGRTVVPIQAVLPGSPVPLEIELNIVYSVQS